MGRRSIKREAEKRSGSPDASPESNEPPDSSGGEERQQTTWRARKDLLEELDEWADQYDMSRNAAITMLVRQGLDDK